MAGNSLAIKDSARIIKLVRQKAYAATLATLEKAAANVLRNMQTYREYNDITGNTWTSTTVGIFYKGRLVSLLSMAEGAEEPTRKTLRAGEVYDLPEYYGGGEIPVNKDTGEPRPYKGKYGKGGQWGPSLGPWFMRRQHNSKRKTWNMVVAIPVSYAGYNYKIVDTLQKAMDDLPNVVDYNIVRVENAPSQSDIPF